MEASMAAQAPPVEQTDALRSPKELYRYSAWIHLGADAEDCEQRETGCSDPGHFHAWLRLPNQIQHQDIRERALAAKARRLRQMRDPDTDAYAILEADMDDLLRAGDRDALVAELVDRDWWKRQIEASGNVEEREEFKTIDRDRERMLELLAKPENERPADEFSELERHMEVYSEAVAAEREQLDAPLRQSLEALETYELVNQIRENRIAEEAQATFMDVYHKWQWLAGTYSTADPISRKRKFASMDELEELAPEVIDALRDVTRDLETALQRGLRGN